MLQRGKEQLKLLQIGSNNRCDFLGGLLDFQKEVLTRIRGRQDQEVAVVFSDPFGAQPPKLSTQCGNVPMLHFFGQTQKLECQDQVVSPQDHLQVGGVGPEAAGGNLGHSISTLELAEQKFLEGSVAVQTPHCLWSQLQVGDQSSVIGVVLEGEKPFLDFFGFLSHGSAHGHISVLCFPVERSLGKLGCLPTAGKIVVSSLDHAVLQRLVHSGNDGVAQPSCIEGFDNLSVVEGSIEPHPGAAGSNRGRKFLQDRLQEVPGARGGVHVARSEFHPQAQTAFALAGDDRCVRSLAMASFGDVAHRRTFLGSIGDQRCGIGIDDGTVEQAQSLEEVVTESVVRCFETLKFLSTEAPQKSPQSVAMRKVGKTQDRWDQAVVDQALSAFDSSRASHNGKEVSQKKIHRMIVPVLVIGPAHVELQEAA